MRKPFIIFLLLLTLGGLGALWWQRGSSPADKKSTQTAIFVIQKGEGIRSIARRLKEEKLVADPIIFFLLVWKMNLSEQIQAGDFRLSPAMAPKTIMAEFTHGTLDVWVTLPEGLRSEEIAQILKEKISTYEAGWVFELKKNEGYLFPDTYLIPKDADINLVIKIMQGNFEKKWKEFEKDEQEGELNLTEAVILASIVEREAKFNEDRALVTGVLLNRLKGGMHLQADATVQYAIGKINGGWWKKGLTREDLKINSPFNTYVNYGLPPGPISNPGLDSLRAAVFPAKTRYLYYLSSPDGRMHYAQTLEEHNQNIEKYL